MLDSFVKDPEESVFWTSMIQGYTGIPFFILNLMIACNTYLSILFTTMKDLAEGQGESFQLVVDRLIAIWLGPPYDRYPYERNAQ